MYKYAVLVIALAACGNKADSTGGASAGKDKGGKGGGEKMGDPMKTEAYHQLNKIMKNAKVFYITNNAFPVGKTATLPAAPCCKGPDGMCPVDTASWAKDPTWAALDFQIDEPNRFQYTYDGSAGAATATAVGDLDCDGVTITFKLNLTSKDGMPSGIQDMPPPNSD